MRARVIFQALAALDHCCGHCKYEESDGSLIRHCDKCCRRIVAALGLLRRNMRGQLVRATDFERKPVKRTRYYARREAGGTLG